MLTVQSDNVAATVWMDKKPVTSMYTGFDPKETTTVLRRQKDGSRVPVPCPAAIAAYNRHMGGVDRGDQLRSYHQYGMKRRKFYKYIFNFMVGVSLTNAFILYCIGHPGTRTTTKAFQEAVAKGLIGDYHSRKRAGRVSHQVPTLPLRHFPMKVEKGSHMEGHLFQNYGCLKKIVMILLYSVINEICMKSA